MAYIRFSNNPLGKTVGDCVIRAICVATGDSWDKVFWDLCEQAYELADLPASNTVWDAYLRKRGFERRAIPNNCPNCYTVNEFALDHPYGTYILGTGTHAVTVKNGNVYDAWNSLGEVPICYYALKEV